MTSSWHFVDIGTRKIIGSPTWDQTWNRQHNRVVSLVSCNELAIQSPTQSQFKIKSHFTIIQCYIICFTWEKQITSNSKSLTHSNNCMIALNHCIKCHNHMSSVSLKLAMASLSLLWPQIDCYRFLELKVSFSEQIKVKVLYMYNCSWMIQW